MPIKRTHEEFISKIKELVGDEYKVLSQYVNSNTHILMKHTKCNHEWNVCPSEFLGTKNRLGTRCPICVRKNPYNKLSFQQVKHFIEIESNSGCELLTKESEYFDTSTKLNIKCSCNTNYTTNFIEFKHSNKQQCNICGFNIRGNGKRLDFIEVKKHIENHIGYYLLENEYKNNSTPLAILCPNGHIFKKSLNDFKKGSLCPQCMYDSGFKNYKFTYEEVNQFINKENYVLLSKEYINSQTKIKIKCDKDHIFDMTFDSFKNNNQRCPICYKESIFNPLQPLNIFLRSKINQWKLDSASNCNYKCVITKEDFDDIHHIYSFQSIVKETLSILKYPILDVGEYGESEINNIITKNLELHYKYGLGVCLTRDIHRKFHSMYGIVNNTYKQFEDFKQNINNY